MRKPHGLRVRQRLTRVVGALQGAYRSILRGLLDHSLERGFRTATAGVVDRKELGRDGPNAEFGENYEPTPRAAFTLLMKDLPAAVRGGSFVDFGSGKGRAVILAASYGFRRVIGVEYVRELHEAAVRNIDAAGLQARAASVHADAATFPIPDGPSVLYFFNPFHEPVVWAVAENVRRSYERDPRPMAVIYFYPRHPQPFDQTGVLKRRPRRLSSRIRHALLGELPVILYETAEAPDCRPDR